MHAAIDPEIVVAVAIGEMNVARVRPIGIPGIQPIHGQVANLLSGFSVKVHCPVAAPEDGLAQKRQRHRRLKYLAGRFHIIEYKALRGILPRDVVNGHRGATVLLRVIDQDIWEGREARGVGDVEIISGGINDTARY